MPQERHLAGRDTAPWIPCSFWCSQARIGLGSASPGSGHRRVHEGVLAATRRPRKRAASDGLYERAPRQHGESFDRGMVLDGARCRFSCPLAELELGVLWPVLALLAAIAHVLLLLLLPSCSERAKYPTCQSKSMPGTMLSRSCGRLMLLYAALFTGTLAKPIVPPCTITRIDPGSGPSSGGTKVTVIGTNLTGAHTFAASHTFCRWGQTGDLVKPGFLSATRMICLSPPSRTSNPEKVTLFVTNDGGYTFSTDVMSYFYEMQELVTSLQPSIGPERGDTLVMVRGQGFRRLPKLSCMFGTTIVSASWISDTMVECLSIAMPAGTDIEVRVANNGQDFTSSAATFSYKGTLWLPPYLIAPILSPSVPCPTCVCVVEVTPMCFVQH